MTVEDLPTEYKNVMVTYIGKVYVPDKYYGKWITQKVTRRGFYSKSDGYYDSKDNWIETPDGYFHIPSKWKSFSFSDGSSALLPSGFYGGRVMPDKVISWRELNNEKEQ